MLISAAESETIITSALTALEAAEVLRLLPDSEPGQDVVVGEREASGR
jgi:hypothetical protein